jgi:hypothetical protein
MTIFMAIKPIFHSIGVYTKHEDVVSFLEVV